MKALGPLKLTVTLEDYMKDFCDSLETEASSTPVDRSLEPCCLVPREDAMTVTNLDSGDLHPLDHPVWNSSDDSVCDRSSNDCDLLKDMPPPDWNQWLDELMEDLGMEDPLEDSLYDSLKDMSPNEWAQVIEDLSFDLDDF